MIAPIVPPLKGEVTAKRAVGFRNNRRRQRRHEFSGESRKTAEFGGVESMAPEFVARTGSSNRLSALPTGCRCVQAQPA